MAAARHDYDWLVIGVHVWRVNECAPAGRDQHLAEFPTTVVGLLTWSDWLAAFGVTQVTMEATGVYWKPVWAILEDEFECVLVNARQGVSPRLAGSQFHALQVSRHHARDARRRIRAELRARSRSGRDERGSRDERNSVACPTGSRGAGSLIQTSTT